MMLQQETPDDYVIATGETHSVREFLTLAFGHVGLDWNDHVTTDERLYRPAEIHELRGDCSKAQKAFGWEPTVSFQELVERMGDADVERLKGGEGFA